MKIKLSEEGERCYLSREECGVSIDFEERRFSAVGRMESRLSGKEVIGFME